MALAAARSQWLLDAYARAVVPASASCDRERFGKPPVSSTDGSDSIWWSIKLGVHANRASKPHRALLTFGVELLVVGAAGGCTHPLGVIP